MYPVSQEFLEKIRANKRQVFAKVTIDYTDPFLDQSISILTNENANISYPNQTADNVQVPIGKIASLDGSWVLDGTYVLAPIDPLMSQMGWWGAQLSDANGDFVLPYPTLTVQFNSRPITKLQVIGDSARGEYPVNFNIYLYGDNDVLLYIENVSNNTNVIWNKTLDNPVTQVVKMVLEITKWSHAGRQVKIVEFFTSIQETYEGEDIIKIDLIEERDVGQNSLPIGSITSNEIQITLNNVNRKFDAGNTQSSLYQLLKPNRKIKAWLGVKHDNEQMEWVPLGVFWSGDWTAKDDEVTAQTTGRDRLDMLMKTTYENSQVWQNVSLYNLAINVLEDAGLTADEYWVDNELQDFTIPYAYFEPISHREALRRIAEACVGQCYCDRDGIIRIEGPSFIENQDFAREFVTWNSLTIYTWDELKSHTWGDINIPFSITHDEYFRKDNPVKWSEIANYIEVETQPLKPDATQEVYRSNESESIGAGETKTITVRYNSIPCVDAVATLQGTGTISNVTYYSWGANVTVTSATAGTFEIIVNAKPLKVVNQDKIVVKDDASIEENGQIAYKFPANPLIQTRSIAVTIANKLLNYYKNPQRDMELEWRGNPVLLLGDKIRVVDQKEKNDYYIVKQELEYSGALRAKLSGKRV